MPEKPGVWTVDEKATCHLCILDLSYKDKDYGRDLMDAKISPELLEVSLNQVCVRIFQSTCTAPVCKLLNTLHKQYPNIHVDTEIHIEFWEAWGVGSNPGLTFAGEGWYTIESTTEVGYAPMIRLARSPSGKMCGFMHKISYHSVKILKWMKQEAEYGKSIEKLDTEEEEPDA